LGRLGSRSENLQQIQNEWQGTTFQFKAQRNLSSPVEQ
jgi:hypothetical protein